MENFIEIIEAGDFDHYGIRAHRGETATVGSYLGKSHVWLDGECTDDELDGICALKVTADTFYEMVALLKKEYIWNETQIVLVGGYERSYGEDNHEIIIKDNVCLATA